jgi:CRP/FNR family transcriptional regulator, cyclic AMP receptor protein
MKAEKRREFAVEMYFETLKIARMVKEYRKNQMIFAQGDPANEVRFIRRGRVKRTVVSPSGREAVVGILGSGDFFGEWCLSERPICIATATAMEPTSIVMISKEEMLRALHAQHELSDRFIAYLLSRTIRVEEDLIDQLFNSTEKRLARALLRLARFGHSSEEETRIPKVSQQMLAEMIGTTRTRVNYFMNKFRKLGFIDYNGELKIRRSLLNVILRE